MISNYSAQKGTKFRFQHYLYFFLVTLNMQASVACVLGLVMCQSHMHRWRAVSTLYPESVGPGSISGGRKSILLEVISFFPSSFQSRMIYQNKSELSYKYHINMMNNPQNSYQPFSSTKIPCTSYTVFSRV